MIDPVMQTSRRGPSGAVIFATVFGLALLPGCTTVGSMMSPYSEKFSCRNDDHGQCIHPDQAYQDAVAGKTSRSTPAVTNDRKLLRVPADARPPSQDRRRAGTPGSYAGYRDSVYQELKGLVEAPVTPMLKTGRTVRTLILPYADRQRPDRLYMPRYVYAIVEKPVWVVGGYLVTPPTKAASAPVLGQVREPAGDAAELPPVAEPKR